ncbi:hypothetical protein D3C81_1952190 [compost metagenome]
MAAIAAHQRPLPRLMAALDAPLDQHRMTGRYRLAVTGTQFCRTYRELPGQVQVFQGHAPDHFGDGITEHVLGAGVEGADHPAQVRGDDRDLGRGIQHPA